MHYVLFDEELNRKNLLPFTFTRAVSDIRIGILTVKQKWDLCLPTPALVNTVDYLQSKYPAEIPSEAVFINASVCPSSALLTAINALSTGQGLTSGGNWLVIKGARELVENTLKVDFKPFNEEVLVVENLWDIFQKNAAAIQQDFTALTANKKSEALSKTVTVIGDANKVFLEPGAKAEACILNTTGGPIYLGADSEIMEGSAVRGPFALCEHSALKLNTKIYGATTIGPHSKVGGEVNNSVIFGYSNKAHDGFLGNAVIGEWCNLGADTNNSNLKNNYGNVKLFNYRLNKPIDTGLQFCGLMMGDYSKSGINTMFNTGTVVGVACNVYGGGFPPTHIADFSWGGSEGFITYQPSKLFETSQKVFERRGLVFGELEKKILTHVFNHTNNA